MSASVVRTAAADKGGRYTYIVNLPNGSVVLKNYRKAFTHAVVVNPANTDEWFLHGFSSSHDLARKAAMFYADTPHLVPSVVPVVVTA